MSEITKSTAKKVTFHDGSVSLEVKHEDEWPLRYTIFVGPRDSKTRTRLELGEENFAALQRLIAEAIQV